MVGALGLLIERFLIRRLYGRSPDDPLLLTFGLSLVLDRDRQGRSGARSGSRSIRPGRWRGAVDLGFMAFPAYRLFVIAVTVAVLIGLWASSSRRTNVGLIIRAGSRDPLMVRALGIDLNRIWLLVFGIGYRAGRARPASWPGPMRGAYAEMGVTMVIESFVVVVVGGMGSLLGAVVAGLLIGQVVGHHHALRAQARRDHGVRGDGGRPARAAERPLRRGRARGVSVLRRVALRIAAHPGARPSGIFFALFPFIMPYRTMAYPGADLRPASRSASTCSTATRAALLRPRGLLRPRRLRHRHRARQAPDGLALARARLGSAPGRPGRRRDRLLLPAAARHLLRDADPRLRPAPLLRRASTWPT